MYSWGTIFTRGGIHIQIVGAFRAEIDSKQTADVKDNVTQCNM